MADWPQDGWPVTPVLTPWSPESLGPALVTAASTTITGLASATVANNVVFAYPFTLRVRAIARQLLCFIGATSNGNLDVGIYDGELNLVVSSGSTAMGTINVVQEFNITDTAIGPGEYFLAVWFSSATGTCFGLSSTADEVMQSSMALYTDANTSLPNPLVPVISTTATPQVWVIGIQFAPVF